MRSISDRYKTVRWMPHLNKVRIVGLDNQYEYPVEDVYNKCHICGEITPISETYHKNMDQKTLKKYVHRCTDSDIIELTESKAIVKVNNFHLYCSENCKVVEKL